MNKAQLIEGIAASANISKADAAVALDAMLETLVKGLLEDGTVALVGHGTYTLKKREARVGRDPRTGNPLQIPASMVVGFKPGKALKDAVNEKIAEEAGA